MKKSMLFAAAAVVAMASCTNEDFTGFQQAKNGESAINFGSVGKTVTRADKVGTEAADLLNNNFVVEGVKSDGTYAEAVEVFKYYNVNYYNGSALSTESNTNGWEYVGQTPVDKANVFQNTASMTPISSQTIKYWDFAKSQYDFVAFSQGKGYTDATTTTYAKFSDVVIANLGKSVIADASATPVTYNDPVYTVDGTAKELASAYVADLVTVYNADFGKTVVTPKFRSMGAKIRMAIYETVPGYSVKDVKFYISSTATAAATDGKATLYTETASLPGDNGGQMSVYFPVVGSTNTTAEGYNVASIKFIASTTGSMKDSINFETLDYSAVNEAYESSSKKYLGRTSSAATYAGDGNVNYYTVVLPTGEGHVLNLKVDYTLVPIDGGEETITVTGATAQVPSVYTNWQPNYAYTYIFKISDQTNGYTDPDHGGLAGLYPITFDAIVMDSEDGIQETITEIGKPAITTYQKGKVVTKNDEYIAGSNIYVDVNDANDSEPLLEIGSELVGGVNLFTATVENGAIQSITEASVANCFTNGVVSGDTYTVTDSKGKAANKKLVLTNASSALALSATIPAADAPHDVTVTPAAGNFAVITPVAHTNYVFQYKTALAEYDDVDPNTLTYNVDYYTLDKSGFLHKFTAKGNEVWAENTYYTIDATSGATEFTSGTLTAGMIYYTSATADGGFAANGSEVPSTTNKYYSITPTPVVDTDCTTLTAGETYYLTSTIDTNTKVGTKMVATGNEAADDYQVCTTPAQYAYKVIIVK